MKFDDVIALAKAGFTVEQISQMAGAESSAPEPAQPAEPAKPAETVADPQIKALNDRIDTIMATIADLGKVKVQDPKDDVKESKDPEPGSQPTIDDVLKSINGLEQKVQSGLMQAIEQPTPVTAETVLAKIINPPTLKE